MRIGSLFSGAGGLDMAVEYVFGGEVIWQSEIDHAASKVLKYRFPCAPNLGDITRIDWKTVEPVAVICGGYPCQPFSQAGQRQGTDDERHLWPYFAEAIRRIRPRYAVLENVAGHRSMGFDTVLADLASSGYDAQWCSLRASDVGAPHIRERVFILAADTESDRPSQSVIEGRQRVQAAARRNSSDAVTCAVCGKTHMHGIICLNCGFETHLLPTPQAADGERGPSSDIGGRRESGAKRAIDLPTVASRSNWGKYELAIKRWELLVGPAPQPTELNNNGNPRLSASFAEWMMGWPDGWVTDPDIGISRNDQLRIIGNGVVPAQCAYALRHLLTVAEVAA